MNEPDEERHSPEENAAIVALFGERTQLAQRFAHHLSTTGVERGLLGPREVPRLWSRHILNCAVVQELIPQGHRVADVGAGAGLPGIALALARPDLRFVLLEPLLRRVTWLQEVLADLGLDQVSVVRGRAEDLAEEVKVDTVVARAVAPLDVLSSWCLPLLPPGGHLLAIKGRQAEEELYRHREAVTRLGGERGTVLTVGAELLTEPTTVVDITAGVPRRTTSLRGLPGKRGSTANSRRHGPR